MFEDCEMIWCLDNSSMPRLRTRIPWDDLFSFLDIFEYQETVINVLPFFDF